MTLPGSGTFDSRTWLSALRDCARCCDAIRSGLLNPQEPSPVVRVPWYRVLYIQVLIAVALGIFIGHFFPEIGKALKPLGDGFIKRFKMIMSPIIFFTGVHVVASIRNLTRLGLVGLKTLFY